MNTAAKVHIVSASLLAALVCGVLFVFDPAAPSKDYVLAVVLLCSLALVAEALMLLMPNSVYGSIAFIPYLAAAFIVPNWLSLAGVMTVRVLLELPATRSLGTRVHNVAQQAVTFGCAVLSFRLLGGESLAGLTHLPLSRVTLI